MRRDALLGMFAERGLLLSPEALEFLERQEGVEDEVVEAIKDIPSPGILGLDSVQMLFRRKMKEEGNGGAPTEKQEMQMLSRRSIPETNTLAAELQILKDVTGRSRSTASVDSFVATFQDRYRKIRSMFRGDVRLKGVTDVADLRYRAGHEVSLICMLTDFRETEKGFILNVEDPTGQATVFVRKGNMPDKPILDEVIALTGRAVKPKGGSGISMFVDSIYWPDIPSHTPGRAEEPVSAAFISDVHVGSNTFLKDAWEKFIAWLNSDDPDARRIGYLVMAGDVVDGVGIYPGQEKELEIEDIYEQYRELARYVEMIPDRIKVIMSPGNHDFVRPAEPQPAFGEEIQEMFSGNVVFVGSPSMLDLDGVKVLVYHGTSINDFISNLPGVSFEDPTLALKRMLKSRILAASYGGSVPLAPEETDYMVIDQIPDIFVTGHVHSYARFTYRGVTVINASTWQSQTEYQKMNNFKPVPGVVTVAELDTGRVFEKRFYSA